MSDGREDLLHLADLRTLVGLLDVHAVLTRSRTDGVQGGTQP